MTSRTSWLIGKRHLEEDEREELARRWMESLMKIAHSELLNFPEVRRVEQVDTGVLVTDVMLELLGYWKVERNSISGGRDGFGALCRRIIRRDLIDYAKRIKAIKRKEIANQESLDQKKGQRGAALAVVDADYRLREVAITWLVQSLEKLDTIMPDHHEVLVKSFFFGASLREIAESMGIGKDKVSAMLRKGIAWLVSELPEDCAWL